ncbi:hypothetical protein JZK55_09400 [Dissulfurispira thermophila]|uniref:ResB-like domain-containing protein n=2 Tax=Dissulfurispira thermophila TaxID=2715679 RepID=A0A7G1H0D7_9BACT|nr:hypothetical protein JZK55_09400 [Dissulfurispira thermophila]
MIPQIDDKSPSYFEEWKLKSPQTFYIVDLLQLNRVYTSVWFLTLVFIIMLSLGYSIYQQVKRNIKVHSSSFIVHSKEEVHGKDICSNEQSMMNYERIIKLMRKRRYKLVYSLSSVVHADNEQSTMNDERPTMNYERILVFSKNSINRWGGVIFHSGLFLIIVAAIVGLSFQKRGFVQVMEGEVFSGRHEDFLVRNLGIFQKRFDVGFKTQLLKFSHEYWETDQIKDISSSVNVIDKDGNMIDKTIAVNTAVKYKGINIYQSFDYGYALTFVLKSPDGKETVTHFLLDHPDKRTKPFVGKTDFPQTPYIFNMKFYPDISMNSFHLGKPILYLQVLKGINNMVFDGLVIPGNVIKVEGNLVRFYSISQWSGLIYAKSPDMSLAYAGFFISCIGVSIIFLLPHKEIYISHKDNVVSLYSRTNRYKPLFKEEMEKIKEELSEQ